MRWCAFRRAAQAPPRVRYSRGGADSEKFPGTAGLALGGREATARKSRPTCFRGNSLGARSSRTERKPKSESRDSGRSAQARPRGFPGGRPLRRGYRPLARAASGRATSARCLRCWETYPSSSIFPFFRWSGDVSFFFFFSLTCLSTQSAHVLTQILLVFQALTATQLG